MNTDGMLADLCDELEEWCKQRRLPYESADELILREGLDSYEHRWLHDFIQRWDRALETNDLPSREDVLSVLDDLVTRCDGAEGVRADGSNIDTLNARMMLEKFKHYNWRK